jgi:hypothetical protein
MALALQSSATTEVPRWYQPLQIPQVLWSYHSFNWRQRSNSHKISHHLSTGCNRKLVFQTPTKMHLFLAAVERQVSPQLLGVLNRAWYWRRFSVLCSTRERNIAQLLPQVPLAQSASTGGVRWLSYCTSYQSSKGGTLAQSPSKRVTQNIAEALWTIHKI